ncbi:membrane protein insertase YidC [Azovibrio restrictus]|uniref:membrane protein insertase YidC n=1 Tax=Azovibrio restrictus TaxID=146938 RepID=UPI0026F30CA1|nr:membrane protein insertase YidC [Azovibrio restrictus]
MDTRRLMLLLVFGLSLFMLWDAWVKYQNPVPAPQAGAGVSAPAAAEGTHVPQPGSSLKAVASQINEAGPGTAAAETLSVATDLFKAEISTQGGDLVWMELSQYKSHSDKEKQFQLFEARHKYAAQTGLIGDGLPNHKTLLKPVPGPRELADGQDAFQVRLEAPTVNGVKATKVYTFRRNSYLIDVAWEIENGGQQTLAPHAYFQLQRDQTPPDGDSFMLATFTGAAVYTEAEKYQKVKFEQIGDGSAKFAKQANDGWLAMVQHYFVAAWAPQGGMPREFYMRKIANDPSGGLYTAGVIVPVEQLAPGAKAEVKVPLFAGPQEQARLKEVAPGLDLVVDYGWLHIIAAPIFWALEFINKLVGNWGWSIVVLTVIIKLIFFPLSAASYKSMAKMRKVTPRLMQLKERFADDKMRLNQEMMKLYQTEKINPLGGCLPILIQIPVFIALYWVLLGAVEMRDAPWVGWITDLSSPDPWYVLPAIMMATMFIQIKLNPTPPDPIQAKVMMIMPLIFGIMFFFFPAGLVLYWVVNNVLSIAQQWQITRMIESGEDKPKAANDAKA